VAVVNSGTDVVTSRLADAGLSARESEAKAPLYARTLAALKVAARDARLWWVPGRLEFLGKHTDYAGGPSLVCAIERGFAVAAVPRGDRCMRIVDASSGESLEADLRAQLVPPRDHWSNYALTVARRVGRNFPGSMSGVDVAFASDLPPAAGLSSSSALIVATFLALDDANDLSSRPEYRQAIRTREDLAGYLGSVENGSGFRSLAGDDGVGTRGGSQDHTAILCARPGTLMQYVFAPTRFERAVPLPHEHLFVVAVSGVIAAKTGSALARYNHAAATAATALDVWRATTGSQAPTLAAALDEVPNAVERFRTALNDRAELVERVEQLHIESGIVRAAGDALAAGDLGQLGKLVDQSQAAAERLLGNQVPETIELARSARELGAVAASAFGAGFGGSVYALVPASDAEALRRRWMERYATAFPNRSREASFFVTRAGPAATVLPSLGT
jgi:galactokinase